MPTYTCWSQNGAIPIGSRDDIVHALAEIHHEVAIAPRYFVQVIFNDLDPGSIYVAGQAASEEHIWIRADIRAGRTDEQKGELLGRIASEIGTIVGTEPENIWVYICDIPGPSISEFGRVLPNPGQEEAWFAELPPELQARLSPLA